LESGEGGASSGWVEKNEWDLDPNTLLVIFFEVRLTYG
jgi:hypothetical protein